MLNWIVCDRTDYLHKNGFGVNNQQSLLCHETKPNQTNRQFYFIQFSLE